MNLLQKLQKFDEQEYEALRCQNHQCLKRFSDNEDINIEENLLGVLNDIHNILLAWRTQQTKKTIGSDHPISLRAHCPECEQGTLMLDVFDRTATVVCSHCENYNVEG